MRPTEIATDVCDTGRDGKRSRESWQTETTELSVVSGSCGSAAARSACETVGGSGVVQRPHDRRRGTSVKREAREADVQTRQHKTDEEEQQRDRHAWPSLAEQHCGEAGSA